MAWDEVEGDPEFQALPSDRKDRIKRNYFDSEIAPNVPPTEIDTVRADFFGEPRRVAAPRPADMDVSSGPPGGGANAPQVPILGSDDFPEAEAPAARATPAATRGPIQAVKEAAQGLIPAPIRQAAAGLRDASAAVAKPIAAPVDAGIAAVDSLTPDAGPGRSIAIKGGAAAAGAALDEARVPNTTRNAARAMAGLAAQAGGVAAQFGFKEAGALITEVASETAKELGPRNQTIVDEIEQAAYSSLPFFVFGAGMASAGARMGGIAARLAPHLGAPVMTVAEAMVNSGEVYNRIIEKGGTPQDATLAANRAFTLELPMDYLANRLYFPGKLGQFSNRFAIVKGIETAFGEGAQEAGQSALGSMMAGDPVLLEEIAKAGLLGALVGGAGGVASTMAQRGTAEPEVAPGPAEPLDAAPAEEVAPIEYPPEVMEAAERLGAEPEAVARAMELPPEMPPMVTEAQAEGGAPVPVAAVEAPAPIPAPEVPGQAPVAPEPASAIVEPDGPEFKKGQEVNALRGSTGKGRVTISAFLPEKGVYIVRKGAAETHYAKPENLEKIAEEPSDSIAPEDGDTSFFEAELEPVTPDEIAAAEKAANAPVTELEPAELARRFPQAPPEAVKALLRRAAQKGYPISPAAMEAFPDLKAEVAEGSRAAQEAAQRGEAGASNTPASDMLRRMGGIDIEGLERVKERGEGANLEGRGILRRGGEIKGWDGAAEILYEAGLIRERDVKLAQDLLDSEARASRPKKSLGAAAPKTLKAVKPRAPALMPEEVHATAEAGGVKVGVELPLLRGVDDPIFGKIKKGTAAKIVAVDLEGGLVLVEYGEAGLYGRDVAVIPIEALAKPVRADVPEQKPAEVKAQVKEATGVSKPETPVVTTEEKLLYDKLKNQQIGSRAAERKGAQDLRHEIKRGMVQSNWEQATRSKIVEFARAFLPASERGSMLTAVANARSPKDLVKAFVRIDAKVTLHQNKQLARDIRILFDRVMASKSFPVSVKSQIREMLSDVRLENWSEATLDRLRLMQELVDHMRATGEDVIVPQRILDQLKKLASRPLSEIPTQELSGILSDLQFLVERGKDIRAAALALDELERQKNLADLVAGTKKVERPSTTAGNKRKFLGPALSWASERKNEWLRVSDFLQQAGIAISPIQVVVDDLDGTILGGGANRRIIWDRLQNGFIAKVDARTAGVKVRDAAIKKFGMLDQQQQDRVTLVLMREQEGGREKLHQLGVGDEEIDAVKLNDAERGTLEMLRGHLNTDARKDALARVAATLYNQEFKVVDNYWPMKTDRSEAPKEGLSAVEVILENLDARRKNVKKGSLIERVEGGKQKIRADLYDVFMESVDEAAMLEHVAGPILKARALVDDPKYREAAGDAGADFWKDYLDALARDGGVSAARRNAVMDFIRTNLGTAALTFKPHVALIQLSSLGPGATLTGGENMRKALLAPEWDAFVDKNMPLVRERQGGDPSVREVMEGGLLPKVREAGFKHIVAMDHWTAVQVAKAAYFQWADLHGVEPDLAKPQPAGLRHAQSVVGRSMASPWIIDMPLALSRGNITGNRSLDKSALQFQSETLSKFALYKQIFKEAGKDKVQFAKRLGFMGASLLYESGVRSAWIASVMAVLYGIGAINRKQYEDRVNEDDLTWKMLAMNALNTIPFLGSVGNYIAYDSGPIPMIDVAGDAIKGVANMTTGSIAGKPIKTARGLTQALTAAALLAGIPGAGVGGWIAKQPLRGLQDKKKKKNGWAR